MRHVMAKNLALAVLGCAALMSAAAQSATGAEASTKMQAPSAQVATGNARASERSEELSAVPDMPEVQQPLEVPPLTPEQLPAAPPRVRYQDGQLTIESENSTLADIILLVSRVTGAQLETPPGFGTERVASRLGPGSASDVVSELMYGSKFGLILVGTPDNPNAVQKILITKAMAPPEAKKAAATAAAAPPAAPVVQPTAIAGNVMAAAAPPPAAASVPDALTDQPKRPPRGPAFRAALRRAKGRARPLPTFQNVSASAESLAPEVSQPEPVDELPPQ